VVALLLAASAFFVAVEFAFVASDRSKLAAHAAKGRWSAKVALAALKRLSFHLSGAQLGITMVSLVLGYLAEPLAAQLLDPIVRTVLGRSDQSLSIVLALALATVFQMVAGELLPKNIAIAKPEATAQLLAPLAQVVHGVFSPIIVLFNGSANWIVRRMGIEPQEELITHHSLEELEHMIRSAGDAGALDADAHNLLTRTLRFGDRTAADALTPRVHITALPATATIDDLMAEVGRTQHSRYPVYSGSLDNVIGIADVAGIFAKSAEARRVEPVTSLVREPLVVPETRDLIDLLDDFRSAQVQMAVVVDEHGGTAGLLTLEDVLEEIVGEVDDEHDALAQPTIGKAPGVFVVEGTTHVDEVVEEIGISIPEGDYETIAGFFLFLAGRIPEPGDSAGHGGWLLRILEMDQLRIASVELVAPEEPDLADNEADA